MEVTLCQGHRETNFTLAHSCAPWILTLSGDSAAGNRTRVFRVTGGNTNHYTTADLIKGRCNKQLHGKSSWPSWPW